MMLSDCAFILRLLFCSCIHFKTMWKLLVRLCSAVTIGHHDCVACVLCMVSRRNHKRFRRNCAICERYYRFIYIYGYLTACDLVQSLSAMLENVSIKASFMFWFEALSSIKGFRRSICREMSRNIVSRDIVSGVSIVSSSLAWVIQFRSLSQFHVKRDSNHVRVCNK